MNKAQKIIVLIVVGAVAIMCLVPPWQSQARGSWGIGTAGYGFIFVAPDDARGIDVARLFFQLIAVVALGAVGVAAVHYWQNRAPKR